MLILGLQLTLDSKGCHCRLVGSPMLSVVVIKYSCPLVVTTSLSVLTNSPPVMPVMRFQLWSAALLLLPSCFRCTSNHLISTNFTSWVYYCLTAIMFCFFTNSCFSWFVAVSCVLSVTLPFMLRNFYSTISTSVRTYAS